MFGDSSATEESLKTDIIDETPELKTFIEDSGSEGNIISKFFYKISKGFSLYTITTILCYTLNCSSLLLPSCLQTMKIFIFLCFLIFVFVCSYYVLFLLLDTIIKNNSYKSFNHLVYEGAGRGLSYFYHLIHLFYRMSLIIYTIYLILSFTSQIITLIFDFSDTEIASWDKKGIILLSSLIVIQLPISFIPIFRRPDIPVVILIFLFILMVLFFFFTENIPDYFNKTFDPDFNFNRTNFIDYGFIMLAVCWNSELLKNFSDFKIKTQGRYICVIYFVMVIKFILSFVISVFGLACLYRNESNDYTYLLFDQKNFFILKLILMGLVILFLHTLIGYQLQHMRESFICILKPKKNDLDYEFTTALNCIFTIICLILVNGLIFIIKDIHFCLSIAGGLYSTIMNFLFPTIVYMHFNKKEKIRIVISWLITIINIIFGICSLIVKVFIQE